MAVGGVSPTISPSMDIQISSNFERLLFDLFERDGAKVRQVMADFRKTGSFSVTAEEHRRLRRLFDAHRFDDRETAAEIAARLAQSGELVDPHSAIGTAAARAETRPEIRSEEHTSELQS